MDNIPVGIDATGERIETGSVGAVAKPADYYWEAPTQRSQHCFLLGDGRMPTFGLL